MSSITTRPAPTANAPDGPGPEDLRLVLFGMPEAGKTSLLGALGLAAKEQEHLLGGRLIDESGGLTALAHQVYDLQVQRTASEVVPYPVRYEPVGPDAGRPLDAVLMDCDGEVAINLLARKKDDPPTASAGKLAGELSEADALVLVIDAAAPSTQVEADFIEFDRFLRLLEEERGEKTEVAGLPVFIVLTKCDLLARATDSAADWMDRIEQRKRDVDAKFRDFLSHRIEHGGTAAQPVLAFGRINLHVWATATKRPGLLGAASRPREPYGVAELFRQCLLEAAGHRRREEKSERKLAWLVAAAAALLLSLIGLTVTFLVYNQTTQTSTLATRVDELRFLDRESPAERLAGSLEDLQKRLARLQELRKDPNVGSLPADLRSWLEQREKELADYVAYYEQVLRERSPAGERSEVTLARQMRRLNKELALPNEEWATTFAGLRRKALLEMGRALSEAVLRVRGWYEDQSLRIAGHALSNRGTLAADAWPAWAQEAEDLLAASPRREFRPTEPVPGAGGLTYEVVQRFDEVLAARASWETDQARLKRQLDVATAVGLVPPTPTRSAVLVFPRGFKLAEARDRLARLKEAYPDYEKTFVREGLPLRAMDGAIRAQYENLLAPARAEVLRQLRAAGSGREETAARWDAVRAWLKEPGELAYWRPLAMVLLRMQDTLAEDPVTQLASYLGRMTFDLAIDSVVVEIPRVRGLIPAVDAPLEVYVGTAKEPSLRLTPSGKPQVDGERGVTGYTFRAAAGQRLRYRPGDELRGTLELRGGKERLSWGESRSRRYQFEALRSPPRLQSVEATSPTDGKLMDDVRLTLRPTDGVPAVPDLMPTVRLEE